jgi:hypothetical protein
MRNFTIIRCGNEIFFSSYTHSPDRLDEFHTKCERINGGVNVTPTWLRGWYKAECESIELCESLTAQGSDYHWELNDPSDVDKGLPERLTIEESCEEYDDSRYVHYIGSACKYWKYSGFYNRVAVKRPFVWVPVEFSVVTKGDLQLSDVSNFTDMKIKLSESTYRGKDVVELSKLVSYSELELMLVPPLAIHNRPCTLGTDDVYRIVRQYIRENIDGRYARISSDYDFCFSVEKIVPIKPYTIKEELRTCKGKRYNKPRFSVRTVDKKQCLVFEMTDRRKYNGYPVIGGFSADSLGDMVNQVKQYLDDLMSVINEPVRECEHCHGTGHVLIEKEKPR